MRKFRNKITNIVECVTNEILFEQYTKRPELWEELEKEIKEKKTKKK